MYVARCSWELALLDFSAAIKLQDNFIMGELSLASFLLLLQ